MLQKLQPQIDNDIWSLDNFIFWLELQDPDQTYRYTDPYSCAVHQYLRSRGVEGEAAVLSGDELRANGWDDIVNGAGFEPDTFGAALARAKEVRNGWSV